MCLLFTQRAGFQMCPGCTAALEYRSPRPLPSPLLVHHTYMWATAGDTPAVVRRVMGTSEL